MNRNYMKKEFIIGITIGIITMIALGLVFFNKISLNARNTIKESEITHNKLSIDKEVMLDEFNIYESAKEKLENDEIELIFEVLENEDIIITGVRYLNEDKEYVELDILDIPLSHNNSIVLECPTDDMLIITEEFTGTKVYVNLKNPNMPLLETEITSI